MRAAKRWRGSIASRIFAIYLLCTLLPISLGSILFSYRMEEVLREESRRNQNISIERVRENLSMIFETGYSALNFASSDETIQEFLAQEYTSQLDFYRAYSPYVSSVLREYILSGNTVSEIILYSANPTLVNTSSYRRLDETVTEQEWYRAYQESGKAQLLISGINRPRNQFAVNESSISLIGTRLSTTRPVPYEMVFKVDLNVNAIYSVLDGEKTYFDFILVDPQGHAVCSTGRQYEPLNLSELTPYETIETELCKDTGLTITELALGERNLYEGWKLIGIFDSGNLEAELFQMRLNVLIVAACAAALSGVLTYLVMRSYTARMNLLRVYMGKIRNQNFEMIPGKCGSDDLGALTESFNLMCARINTLINDVYALRLKNKDMEIEQLRTELRLLQSQVNPHFLFNTLNAMLVVSMKNRYGELIPIIENLAKMMRRLLDWDNELIPIGQELEFIEMYLQIEKFRFRDKIQYRITASAEDRLLKIPKMTIQPLVENACKHGLHKSVEGGTILVTISRQDGILSVQVSDSGVGIAREKSEEITKMLLENDSSGNCIGIQNVFRRLRFHYGEELRFWIEPAPRGGTDVGFSVPADRTNEEETGVKIWNCL